MWKSFQIKTLGHHANTVVKELNLHLTAFMAGIWNYSVNVFGFYLALLASRWPWAVRRLTWLWGETGWDNWASMFGWTALWLRLASVRRQLCQPANEIHLFHTLIFTTVSGGGVRLRLAGRSQTGESISGDLQGGGRDADPWADDRPAEDVGHGQSGHHPTIWRRRPSQVCSRRHAVFFIFLSFRERWWMCEHRMCVELVDNRIYG